MNKKAWDHPWSLMGLHTPRKVPWKGILKQGRFPLKIACRVPAIFWGVAAACFSTDACWRSSCALPGQEKHGSAIPLRVQIVASRQQGELLEAHLHDDLG